MRESHGRHRVIGIAFVASTIARFNLQDAIIRSGRMAVETQDANQQRVVHDCWRVRALEERRSPPPLRSDGGGHSTEERAARFPPVSRRSDAMTFKHTVSPTSPPNAAIRATNPPPHDTMQAPSSRILVTVPSNRSGCCDDTGVYVSDGVATRVHSPSSVVAEVVAGLLSSMLLPTQPPSPAPQNTWVKRTRGMRSWVPDAVPSPHNHVAIPMLSSRRSVATLTGPRHSHHPTSAERDDVLGMFRFQPRRSQRMVLVPFFLTGRTSFTARRRRKRQRA